MNADTTAKNVQPLDDSGKSDPGYIGAKVGPAKRDRYDIARVLGKFEDRSAFIEAACDKLADEIFAATGGVIGEIVPAG